MVKRPLSGISLWPRFTIQASLCQFQVVIAKVRPEESLNFHTGSCILVTIQFLCGTDNCSCQAREQPEVCWQQVRSNLTIVDSLKLETFQTAFSKTAGVPEFRNQSPTVGNSFRVKWAIRACATGSCPVTQGIG